MWTHPLVIGIGFVVAFALLFLVMAIISFWARNKGRPRLNFHDVTHGITPEMKNIFLKIAKSRRSYWRQEGPL